MISNTYLAVIFSFFSQRTWILISAYSSHKMIYIDPTGKSSNTKCDFTLCATDDTDAELLKLCSFFTILEKLSIPGTEPKCNDSQATLVGDLPPPRRFVRRYLDRGSIRRGPISAQEPNAEVHGAQAGSVTCCEHRCETYDRR